MHVEQNNAEINRTTGQHGTIPPILDALYNPAPPQRTQRLNCDNQSTGRFARCGRSTTVYNAPASPGVSTEAIATALLDKLSHLNVSAETAAFHEAFEAGDATPEASEGLHYGINFHYPLATMRRFDAVGPRLALFAYDVLSVTHEMGFYYNVRWESSYALRIHMPFIRVEDVCPQPSPLYVCDPSDVTMNMS